MTSRIIRFPLDIDAIAARAEAAPAGQWQAFPDTLWIPWSASTDEDHEQGDYWRSGRWLAVREFGWHTGSEDPGPELWGFLAAARDDVLSLAAEVRRLRAARGAVEAETPEHLAQRIYEAACSAPGASYEIMTQPAWANLDRTHRACWIAAATEARTPAGTGNEPALAARAVA